MTTKKAKAKTTATRGARLAAALVMTAAMGLSTGARAQGGPGGDGDDEAGLREEVVQLVQKRRLERVLGAVQVDAATRARLADTLGKFQAQLRALRRDNAQVMREVKGLVEGAAPVAAADEQRLATMLDRLQSNRNQIAQVEDQRYRAVRAILPPSQTAKLVIAALAWQGQVKREIMKNRMGRERGE